MVTDDDLVTRFRGYQLDHDNREHYRARLDHVLLVNRCAACGTWHHPPRPICPACWSTDVVPTPVTGRGTIFMAIFLYQGPAAPGVDYATPYPVITVELDEQVGLRFTATAIGASNDELQIGKRVELDWLERDGVPVPAFRLSDRAGA